MGGLPHIAIGGRVTHPPRGTLHIKVVCSSKVARDEQFCTFPLYVNTSDIYFIETSVNGRSCCGEFA